VRSQEDDYTKKLYTQEADDRVVEAVAQVAKNRGIPPAQIALAWLLHKAEVSAPIVGASKPHHLQDAVAAVHVKLMPEEISQLESVYVPHPVLGHH
jgi:aryl-alcohol dehydrogenase-like predicted oxidoreductase